MNKLGFFFSRENMDLSLNLTGKESPFYTGAGTDSVFSTMTEITSRFPRTSDSRLHAHINIAWEQFTHRRADSDRPAGL